jgi:hypothetical protein
LGTAWSLFSSHWDCLLSSPTEPPTSPQPTLLWGR